MMTPPDGSTHGEDTGGHGRTIFHHPSVNRATASLSRQDGSANPNRPRNPKKLGGVNDGSAQGSFRGQQGALRPSKPGALRGSPRPVDNGFGG